MFYTKKSIANFLARTKMLISAVKNDNFVKERISLYNCDEARLDEYEAIYNEAAKAESDKSKEYGEQLEAKVVFDKFMEEALNAYNEHSDFLKLALLDNLEKQRKLLLIEQPRHRRLDDWFKHALEFYDRVLADQESIDAISSRFAISREKLVEGRQKVWEAREAKQRHREEQGEAQDATERRDAAFKKLSDAAEELYTMCTYGLADRPQLLEKLGITVLSAGYKRKKKEKKELLDEAAEVPGETETGKL